MRTHDQFSVGTPRPVAPSELSASQSPASPGRRSDQEPGGLRLLLLEPPDSAHSTHINAACAEAGLSVAHLDRIESAPSSAVLVGVGPSVPDPLVIARQLRMMGSPALLLLFAASRTARDSLQAQLLRDPFVYPRFEIVDLPEDPAHLANRMSKVVSQVKRQLHLRQTTRRGRTRSRASVLARSMPSAGPLLAHVLSQSRDAVLSTDDTGRIMIWNEAADRLLGVNAANVSGRGIDTIDRTQHHELTDMVGHVLRSGIPREGQVTCISSDGRSKQVSLTVTPIRDARGALLGASIIARDDSEYQRVQEALREANRQKDEFLAIMSHELRTPLTSILGYTDMLLRGLAGPLTPPADKYVKNVRAAGDRLLDLVNGLLDYTRLEAGVERLETRPVDLSRLVGQPVAQCVGVARGKQIDLRLAIQEGFDTTVSADEERITHVVRAFVGNALKFTPAGGWVSVNVGPDPDLAQAVRVSVADSGIGMRPEQISRAWERFYQGDASLTRPYGGMGLGLSIARHLVTLHGGTVGAESGGPGMGSTFWFTLPKRQVD